VKTVLVVGGGYAGFYTAWKLEKKLRRDEAEVVVVDPRPYMTYQPFLPEVLAGSVEARHAAVSQRRHLRRSRLISGTVVKVDHAHRTATVHPSAGPPFDLRYDIIVVTAGAVTRTIPIPGVAEQAIGLKHVEEAVAIRDRLLTNFDRASMLPPGPARRRLLTVTFVGGGFSGVEGFGELLSLAAALTRRYPEIDPAELNFHLVEARDRILPEVTDGPGRWVVRALEKRGGRVHLNAQVESARDGHVVLSTGEAFDSDLIVWTVGNGANPMVRSHTDLPIDARGMLTVRADLRVGTPSAPVADAWGAGDDAAVPDLAAPSPGAATVPNAQHAVRQGKLLAGNIVASLRGRPLKQYKHHSLGTVATLGLGRGIFQFHGIVIKGFPAWLMHRGYHVLAVPSWERKVRVLAVWLTALLFGRDIVSLASVQHPRRAFMTAGEPAPSDATASPAPPDATASPAWPEAAASPGPLGAPGGMVPSGAAGGMVPPGAGVSPVPSEAAVGRRPLDVGAPPGLSKDGAGAEPLDKEVVPTEHARSA
jgi:NADH:quinone reductase (non-electrogenic)